MGLLKQAWESRDETKVLAVLKKAIEKNDQYVLSKIASRTASWAVGDEEVVSDAVGIAIVDKLTDEENLQFIAEFADSEVVSKAAVEKLTDQALLADIAKQVKGIATDTALNMLTDQVLLASVAKDAEVEYICIEALKKITDQVLIVDIAKNARYVYVCFLALDKVTDRTLLANIAENAKFMPISREAVSKLTDQMIIDEIIKNEDDLCSNIVVLKKLIFNILGRTKMASQSDETSIIKANVDELLKLNRAVANYVNEKKKKDSSVTSKAVGVIGILVLLKDFNDLISQIIELVKQLIDLNKNKNEDTLKTIIEKLSRLQNRLIRNNNTNESFDTLFESINTEMHEEAIVETDVSTTLGRIVITVG